jgi:hypothetical protein
MSIWLKRVLICASLAAGLLGLGAVTAYAEDLVPAPEPGAVIDQTQTATNTNTTDQTADSTATTDQNNVNVAICVACVNSNNGDVSQSNDAATDSESTNNNGTGQSIDQGQVASIGSENGSVPEDPQEQTATNTNDTGQEANSTAETNQNNWNGSLCALCVNSNNGDVDQSNEAYTGSEATNNNHTAQGVGQDQATSITGGQDPCGCDTNHDGGEIHQSQDGSNANTTDQTADSTATTNQENKNGSLNLLTVGSGNGDVTQSNDAYTGSEAKNNNATGQGIWQDQTASANGGDPCDPCGGGGGGPITQSQDAYNGNDTTQDANSDATTDQKNWNGEANILTVGGGNDLCECEPCGGCEGGGNVDQSNKAATSSEAKNNNATGQGIWQDQSATSSGGGGRPCACPPANNTHEPNYLVEPAPCPCEPNGDGISQTQNGSNDNYTYQKADSAATTDQENKNFGFDLLTFGTGNGDVTQSNDAYTGSEAKNNNATGQGIWQGQTATSGGDACHPCDGGGGGPITQTQDAYNGNETKQEAYSDATTTQKNENWDIGILSVGGGRDLCDPCGGDGGNVDQSNNAYTRSEAKNNNFTGQWIGQDQSATSSGGGEPCCPREPCNPCEPREAFHGTVVCEVDCEETRCEGSLGAITQTQCGANDNYTYQKANSTATTDQENKNFAFDLLTYGSGNGDVTQSNDAYTKSKAKNNNATWQAIWQRQTADVRREPPTTYRA